MSKVVLFVSLYGDDSFGEQYDSEADALVAAADIRDQDVDLCQLLGVPPAEDIKCFLYEGNPLKQETLIFVREV